MSSLNVSSKSAKSTPPATSPPSPQALASAQSPADGPSMEDIFADIRRTLAEEEGPRAQAQPWPESSETAPYGAPASMNNNVVVLDNSAMVTAPTAAPAETVSLAPEPAPPASPRDSSSTADLVAPEAAQAAAHSVGNLVRTLAAERSMLVSTGGPTVENIVRDTVRSLVKEWLDANLPHLVERLVRLEIERLVDRAV